MPSQEREQTNNALGHMWESHRDYLKRMLVGLTHDIDLSDDLLQETYLNAHKGMPTYQGGDARAWLASIARRAFLSHARRQEVHGEIAIDPDSQPTSAGQPGSPDHLGAIELRKAIDSLSPALRRALVMKHFAGLSYGEIAEKLGCPEGTARRRVWTAIRQLRAAASATGEETPDMKQPHVKGTVLLDFLYDAVSKQKVKDIESHLTRCADCLQEVRDMRKVIRSLDAVEGDFKTTKIIDLGVDGTPTQYDWASMMNHFPYTRETQWWTIDKDMCVEYVTVQGEEVTLEIKPSSSRQYKYSTPLPRPVEPGGSIESLLVLRTKSPDGLAQRVGDDIWRYTFQTTPNSSLEWVLALAIRLPAGARLLSASPTPTETRTNGTTTIHWRSALPKVSPREDGTWPWQFECQVKYQFRTADAEERPVVSHESPVKWAPEIVFRIGDLPYTNPGDEVRRLFAEASGQQLPYPSAWFKLGMALYDAMSYEEALYAFARVRNPGGRPLRLFVFASLTWEGHIHDLLGRRQEALNRYRQAADTDIGNHSIGHDQYGIVINKQWVEERLTSPFKRP